MYVVYFFLSVVVLFVLMGVMYFLSYGSEEGGGFVSSYECGFDPIMGSRVNFSFRFFLISVLFLIFDVEVALILCLPYLSSSSGVIGSVSVFLMVLLVGLLYEYYNGVLSWV